MEYVYPYQGETKGEFLSELTWDMKPVYYMGFNVDFGLSGLSSKPGFFSSLAIKAGIPGNSGNMEDRDWLSEVNSDLTCFSKHDNETDELIWIDLVIGASLPIKFIYLKPFISGSWMHFLFIGSNGYGKYADGYGLPPEVDYSGKKCITYQQDWFLLAAGCSIGTNLYPFSFELSFKLSPHTYCAATDNHILTRAIYKDFSDFGLFLEPKGSISLTVKKFVFLLEASYRYISITKGDSYTGYNKSNIFNPSPNKAGAGFSAMDFQFLTKYTF